MMKHLINIALTLLFCTETLFAQSLSHAEEFINLQNKAVAAAKGNSFDETYRLYNNLLAYATSNREVAYLIDTKLCGYVIVNKLDYAEKQLDVQADVCDIHKLIYDSYQTANDLTEQEKVRGIVSLHKTFGEISVQIKQLEIAGNYFENAFNEYDNYAAHHKKDDPYLLNLLAYIDEEYYELYIEAFELRSKAFINMSSTDPYLNDTFLMCYHIYNEATEDLLGKIKLSRTTSQNYISKNVENMFNQKSPIAIGEDLINRWRNLINYTTDKYGKSYIESFNLERNLTDEAISQFHVDGDEFLRGLLRLIYDFGFETFVDELCLNNPTCASVVVPELINMMSETGKMSHLDTIIENVINSDTFSIRFKERVQNRAVRAFSKRHLYTKVLKVLENYSEAIFQGLEVKYDDINILYENLSSLSTAYNELNQAENYQIVSEYYDKVKSSSFALLNDWFQQEILLDKYFDLIDQKDTTQALELLSQVIAINDEIATNSMWHDKLHLSKDWSPQIHSLETLHIKEFEKANDIYKKIIEHCEFWDNHFTSMYRHYCIFLYNHGKEAELHKIISRTYQLMLNEFLVGSFSLNKLERSIFWYEYQYLSEMLETISFMSTEYDSLSDLAYDFALVQKGFLVKYERTIAENVRHSGDTELINAYNSYKNAEASSLSSTIDLEKAFLKLYSTYPEHLNTNFISWREVQNNLNSRDLAIEFTICGNKSYAAVLLRKDWESPKLIELCTIDDIERLCQIGTRIYSNNNQLYSCIWEKLEPYFKKGDNIYFAPHGLVHQLNIEVLCGADGKPMNKKCNLYRVSSTGNLVEDHESLKYNSATLFGGLNYDTDTTSMLAINRNFVSTPSLQGRRLLDESVQTRAGWNYLPGTAEEVRNVGDILGRNKIETTTYTDETGTEESFKALSGNSTPIIHIATHGFYLEDKNARRVEMFQVFEENNTQTISPLKRSGLMFSGGQHAWLGREIPEGIDDGVLTAEEIAGMNLTGTDLLVLSACQTGLGEITNEGVEGLQRGFKIAGVNTIIMSLWEVSDAATEVLMTKFYSLLIKGKTKREAFDAAVEAVKKEYPSPEYWAAFIMLD